MDLFEAIRTRRSIRSFKKTNVNEEEVDRLLEAAISAPSAGNSQPWEFIIVRDRRIKHGLSVAALDQTFIEEAPVVIVVCANEARSEQRYGIRGVKLYSIQDTAAATENILLAANAMGLGACWVGAFREQEARRILETPLHVRPVAIIPVGYPLDNPSPRKRRSIEEIIHKETF